MFHTFDELQQKVRHFPNRKRVAVVAAAEEHVLEAVDRAYREQIVEPILIGDAAKIAEYLDQHHAAIPAAAIRAADSVHDAAMLAVQLVRSGEADFLMKGRLQTAELMRVVVDRTRGLRTRRLMSHIAFLEIPTYHKLLAITDGGIVLHPDLEEKREILDNAVAFMLKMGYLMPNVAVMAAVETINPKMQDTVDAARLKQMNQAGTIANCVVEGPISYDLAISKASAKIKGYDSPVTGDVDLMVAPNIAAGNLMAKSLVYSGGAKMAGVVVGAAAPVVLTSRGSTAEEKFYSLVLAASAG